VNERLGFVDCASTYMDRPIKYSSNTETYPQRLSLAKSRLISYIGRHWITVL
jgi:hypothetical protein